VLEQNPNIDFWQDVVVGITTKEGFATGVRTAMHHYIESKSVVLTNGTFLSGVIHIGKSSFSGGRIGERSSEGLTKNLEELGFVSSRMKTGTPVRMDGRTINFSKMEIQAGDMEPGKFSFGDTPKLRDQKPCYITYTSPEVHQILETGFKDSPMFSGRIEGVGPRYCPSIEDKINRFADKDRHQLFVEPEGRNTVEYYLNGFSSSLPAEIQFKALKKVAGLENIKIFRPGYTIEYDYLPPEQLNATLETKLVSNLYFAGQINGTTGYEEAAAQGLMAGINASLKIQEREPFILKRSEAYIGVLIDDLVTKGVDEPYRMFTSRAEYRILLRQDNADIRLTELGFKLGLASEDRNYNVLLKKDGVTNIKSFLKKTSVEPDTINGFLESIGSSQIRQKVKLEALLLRPEISLQQLISISDVLKDFISTIQKNKEEIIEEAEIQIKYESYINKEQELAESLMRFDSMPLKADFDYNSLSSLSTEARQKLSRIKPSSIGQASRISGISPSDISVLLVFLGR